MTAKNILLMILFSFFICNRIHAQPNSIKGNTYLLKGNMIAKVKMPPACGYIAWGIVLEFEIIEFSDSTYANKNIGLIVTCPELHGKDFFQVGKKYEIKVADENQASFTWSIPNLKSLDKYKLKNNLWVIEAKKIK